MGHYHKFFKRLASVLLVYCSLVCCLSLLDSAPVPDDDNEMTYRAEASLTYTLARNEKIVAKADAEESMLMLRNIIRVLFLLILAAKAVQKQKLFNFEYKTMLFHPPNSLRNKKAPSKTNKAGGPVMCGANCVIS